MDVTVKKGQKIWVWRDRCGVTETTVKTVGTKYITIDDARNTKFKVSDLRQHNGCGNVSFLIIDIDEYNRDCHYGKLRTKLRRFDWDGISSEKLDEIEKILNL